MSRQNRRYFCLPAAVAAGLLCACGTAVRVTMEGKTTKYDEETIVRQTASGRELRFCVVEDKGGPLMNFGWGVRGFDWFAHTKNLKVLDATSGPYPRECEVLLKLDVHWSSAKVEALSAVSQVPWMKVKAGGGSRGDALLSCGNDAKAIRQLFFPGTPLYQKVIREEENFAKTQAEPAPGVPASAQRVVFSDVDKPGYALPLKPDNFALIVGVERYQNLPAAVDAEHDAAAVRAHLLALGYPEGNIIYLRNQEALRSTFEKYLESWLPRLVQEDSQVFVYFSGHGAPDPKSGAAYLLPWDADPGFLENTAYPLKRLYDKLNALKAKEIVVALDSCFSGTGGRSVIAKGTRPLVTKIDTASGSVGRLSVLSASGGDEITGTLDDQGHGLFTYNLLKGLETGRGTVGELYDYLKPLVSQAARRENRDQTPQLAGSVSLRLR